MLLLHFQKIALTEIPWDFVLDKANPSEIELQKRFAFAGGSAIFSKDLNDDGHHNVPIPACPDGVSPMEDFRRRLNDLQLCIIDLAMPRLKEMFRKRAALVNRDFKDCVALEDFITAYRTKPYDNKMRRMVNLLCNEMWGKECLGAIEKHIMSKLRLVYKNIRVDGKPVKSRRLHGSIRKMLVRLKQTLFIDIFRTSGLDKHNEVIYKRHLTTPMKGVVAVVEVTEASHGYDGYLGLGAGHPELDEAKFPTPKVELPDKTQSTLLAFLKNEAEMGSEMTASEILAVWTKEAPPAQAVSVSTGTGTSLSSVSNTEVSVSCTFPVIGISIPLNISNTVFTFCLPG